MSAPCFRSARTRRSAAKATNRVTTGGGNETTLLERGEDAALLGGGVSQHLLLRGRPTRALRVVMLACGDCLRAAVGGGVRARADRAAAAEAAALCFPANKK